MAAPPFEFGEQFRSNLRCLRKASALSQEQLARRASIHRTEVGLLERGERLPRIGTLMKLAGSLEATPNDLLEGIEWLPAIDLVEGKFWTRSAGEIESPANG